ncbi:MAG: ubiquinol-cytochrome C chaperone family protein [Pelagibacteraceae bacterium]|nr:ubiquinol-cytochrome C chaperone family protein [Pelagibacteraceae bacterium]
MNIENLYNKILIDARNPDIFSRFIDDNLNNKIIIFLTFLSKVFNKIDKNDKNYQIFFDYIFHRIETDLRELGYGDMSVNKKMKVIVTKFYSILLDFKNFDNKNKSNRVEILAKYFKNIKEIDEFSAMVNSYLSIDNSKLNDN